MSIAHRSRGVANRRCRCSPGSEGAAGHRKPPSRHSRGDDPGPSQTAPRTENTGQNSRPLRLFVGRNRCLQASRRCQARLGHAAAALCYCPQAACAVDFRQFVRLSAPPLAAPLLPWKYCHRYRVRDLAARAAARRREAQAGEVSGRRTVPGARPGRRLTPRAALHWPRT